MRTSHGSRDLCARFARGSGQNYANQPIRSKQAARPTECAVVAHFVRAALSKSAGVEEEEDGGRKSSL